MSRILESVQRTAKRLHKAGHMSDYAMREFDTIVLDRNLGRPRIEDAANSFEATKPWLALGWSRSTWYRRQAEIRKAYNQ
jgi:hypothetical protein